ncbi:MAG: hypothetical protein U0441_06370 [Polyangiaceae bacterium]
MPLSLGCADVLGLNQYSPGGGGTTSSGGTTSQGGTTSMGGTTSGGTTSMGGTTSSGGTGGVGGATGGVGGTGGATGGTGGTLCTVGEMKPCYEGPPGTEGIGICAPGMSTCGMDGIWGPCTGAVYPKIEACAGDGVDENCDGLPECVGQHRWSKVIVGTGAITAGGVTVDAADDPIIVGGFAGEIDFGGGVQSVANGIDAYVVKLSPDGQQLWTRTFGPAGDQVATAVAFDKSSGSIVVAGYFTGSLKIGNDTFTSQGGKDIFVFKLDNDGNPVWAHAYGGNKDDHATSVAVGPAGEIYVGGGYIDNFAVGGTQLPAAGTLVENAFLLKFDSSGTPLKVVGVGSSSAPEVVNAVAVDSLGAPWVAGNFNGPFAWDGCGSQTPVGGSDAFVMRLDTNTKCVNAHGWGDAADQWGSALSAYPGGNVASGLNVEGTFTIGGNTPPGDASTFDVALVRSPQSGNSLYKRYGDLGTHQFLQGLSVDGLGNPVLGGSYSGGINFSPLAADKMVPVTTYDRYLAKLDAASNFVWQKSFTNSAGGFTFVATDSLGRVDLFGTVLGTTDMGGGTIGVAGSPMSVLLAQFSP